LKGGFGGMDELKLEDASADDLLKQGQALFDDGDYEGAITCYERAVAIKPNNPDACYKRGNALYNLGRHEEAIASFWQAIQLKPDYHEAWCNRGIALNALSRYEEAITNYVQAVQFKPDLHNAWWNQGITLYYLGRYEEAIASFDQTIQLKPDYHEAWYGRGVALKVLGRYEEAIISYDTALRLTQNQYRQVWVERGNAVLSAQGYENSLAAWDEGLAALLPTTPDYQYACGELHRLKGRTQYREGKKQLNPFPDWDSARKSYSKALEFWTFEDPQFTHLHLEVLQELSTVCTYLFSPQELKALLEEATAKLQRILQNPELTLGQKITLETKFAGFNQLQVTNLAQQDPVQALELAEARKNRCLSRLRDGWNHKPPEPAYAQIKSRESKVGDRILCVQDPTSAPDSNEKKNNDPLKWAKREVDSILSFYSKAQPSLIAGTAATKTALEASLGTNYDCLHFTGHGVWPVEDESSALLMIQFHRLLQQQTLSPAQALTQAQEWLRTITYKDLSNWYQSLGLFRDVYAREDVYNDFPRLSAFDMGA
jgi:tetratricopeptide (TPR) repeat protein